MATTDQQGVAATLAAVETTRNPHQFWSAYRLHHPATAGTQANRNNELSKTTTKAVLALASANPHKLREIRQILAPLGYSCLDLSNWPELSELPETSGTFAGNALQKARALHEHCGLVTIADDSGLEVDALGGLPGVHSKRFTPQATGAANNRELLRRLEGQSRRRARFRCAMAVVGNCREEVAHGVCEGSIGHELRGDQGFGYDPLFMPLETPGKSMAELAPQEKNRISHRGRAFRQLPALLQRLFENRYR